MFFGGKSSFLDLSMWLDETKGYGKGTDRKDPSVRTLRSCRINHTPILLSGSVNRKALALRLPIRFLVNMPTGGVGICGCKAGWGIMAWVGVPGA
jgi:hypothetical protein